MNYQQSLAQKNTSTPSIDEGNAQLVLKNNIDEKSQNPIQPKSDMYAPKESCYSNDIESESASENGIRPLSIASVHNGPILSDLDKIKSEPSKQKNEVIEKKENAFLSTPPSSQNDGKNPQSPNKRKKVSTLRSTQIPKYISITKRKPNADKQSEQTTENE